MKKISLFLVGVSFLLPLKGFSNFVDDSTNTKHEFSVSYDMSSKDENPTLPSSMRNTTTSDFSYGLGATFGIYYKISENFSIGSSINPLLLYNPSSNAEFNVTLVKMYLTDMSVICLRYKL